MTRFKHLELPDEIAKNAQAEKTDVPAEKRYNSTSDDWMDEANQQRRLGQYETALRAYGRALECDRSYVSAWVGQAQMLILLNEPRQAEMWTVSGLKLFPNNAELLAARAQAACRLGDYKGALAFNDAAIQGEGTCAYRWSVRGEIMTATKSTTANHCFDSAEQMDADWLVRTENAKILLHYNQPLKALGRAMAAVNESPDSVFAWFIRGVSEYDAGFHRQAVVSFHQVLQLEPSFSEAKKYLDFAQEGGGFWKRLKNYFWRRQRHDLTIIEK